MGSQRGFTYLGLLFAVAMAGILLAATGTLSSTEQQREKERELLFVGNQYRQAIRSYYEGSPGTLKRYPPNLDELLKDNRYLGIKRHLRQLYPDPISGSSEWGIVRGPDGGVMGIYSLSEKSPFQTAAFQRRDIAFEGKRKYSEWQFMYDPITRKN